jgi:hypothetical protein
LTQQGELLNTLNDYDIVNINVKDAAAVFYTFGGEPWEVQL